jgi:hypothetical protein
LPLEESRARIEVEQLRVAEFSLEDRKSGSMHHELHTDCTNLVVDATS